MPTSHPLITLQQCRKARHCGGTSAGKPDTVPVPESQTLSETLSTSAGKPDTMKVFVPESQTQYQCRKARHFCSAPMPESPDKGAA